MADTKSKDAKVDFIVEGNVYVNKDTKVEVTPYFVDLARGQVQFNTLGRGDEQRMKVADFLAAYEDSGSPDSPSRSEKAKK